MKTLLAVAIATLLLTQQTANAASGEARAAAREEILEIRKARKARLQPRSVLAPLDEVNAATVTSEQVGDADSFGRKVKYLGAAEVAFVDLLPDCTDYDSSFGDRCIPVLPGPSVTRFNEADLGRMELPAKATHSLLCYDVSPSLAVSFGNPTPTPREATLNTRAEVIIENPALDDPALIDPATGQPFGGRMTIRLAASFESHTLGPFASEARSLSTTRSCFRGIVSKQSLMDLGLTEKQASQFFKSPTTLRFGASGSASSIDYLLYLYTLRIYGD